MQNLLYYFVFAWFYLLSLLPWRVIYAISTCCYVLVYYVVKYRRGVVKHNLLIAFPEKTDAERKQIEKAFYKSFCDNFIELIKFTSITDKELKKRFKADYELLNELTESGYKVQVHLGHFFNWEFANIGYAVHMKNPFLVVYMPVENKVFNRLIYYIRSRFGTTLIAATNFKNEFNSYKHSNYALVLVADQTPPGADAGFWTNFFNVPTPYVKGPEKGAQFNNTAVVMANIVKLKRGYYQSSLELVTKEARSMSNGEITKLMSEFIEKTIRQNPSNYLWSHRRWKLTFDKQKHQKLWID